MASSLALFLLLLVPAFASVAPVSRQPKRAECPIANVCFAIDQSGSIEPHYSTEIEFVIGIAAALDNRRRDVSYSAVSFSDDASVIHRGTTRLPDFIHALIGRTPVFGRTNVYAGLNTCFTLVDGKQGANGAKNVIIVLSDGARTKGEPASMLAGRINRSGDAFIMAVGIGTDVDHAQLTPLVATGSFYFPTTFKDLPKKIPELVNILCG